MKKIKARLKRFFHCLFTLHRMVDAGTSGEIKYIGLSIWLKREYIGCDCGKVFYSTSEGERLVKIMNEINTHRTTETK
jgi:hypothetical protein